MTEILSSQQDGVLAIQMNREDKKNALTLDMYSRMTELLVAAGDNNDVHVVTITGSNRCFSAGNDLADFLTAGDLDENHPVVKFLLTIRSFEKPIIAGVAGHAVGIGTTLLFHCDMVYASNNAKFQLPFTLLGLCPEAGASLLMPQMMGYAKAAELLLFGEPFDAQYADKVDLVTKVIDDGPTADGVVENGVVEFVASRAKQLAKLPLESVMVSKKLLKEAQQEALHNTMVREIEQFDRLLKSDTCKGRVAAMLNR